LLGLREILIRAAYYLVNLEVFFILVRIVLSWVRPRRYNRTFSQLEEILWRLTEPVLGPIRSRLPTGGIGLDFSPIIAIFLLTLLFNIFQWIVGQL